MSQNNKSLKTAAKLTRTLKSNKSITSPLSELSDAVGEFIRYWGFKRVHGQLWTHIYLSKNSLSGADLTRALNVSKALVSPALTELLNYKLIECQETNGRTKKYSANPDVFKVIKSILSTRERSLIRNAQNKFEMLDISKSKVEHEIDANRMVNLGSMIRSAGVALEFIIDNTEDDKISDLFSQVI